jgi:hypothetical protein
MATRKQTTSRRGKPHDLIVRVTLRYITPPIWRRLRLPDHLTLHQVHRVLQLVFGWQDYHLYSFEAGERLYEPPYDGEAEGISTMATTLRSLQLRAGEQLVYRYDFGDDWEHDILVEKLLPRPSREEEDQPAWPALLEGERAGPPEDTGGPWGYEELLKILEDPGHPEYRERREWLDDAYDPAVFDRRSVANALLLLCAWGAL